MKKDILPLSKNTKFSSSHQKFTVDLPPGQLIDNNHHFLFFHTVWVAERWNGVDVRGASHAPRFSQETLCPPWVEGGPETKCRSLLAHHPCCIFTALVEALEVWQPNLWIKLLPPVFWASQGDPHGWRGSEIAWECAKAVNVASNF